MNITRENLDELDLLIKIEIVENDYAERVTKQLKDYQKKATVPGFRKGMAPMGLIQRMYKAAIVADEVNSLLGESLYKYIDDEKLNILGSPLSNEEKTGKIDFEKEKDFVFYFDAAVSPEVKLAWDKVDATLYKVSVTPEDIDKQVKEVCERYGSFESPETVGENDYVYGKIVELDNDGNDKEGGVSTFTSFDLSTIQNKEELMPLFVGKKADEKIVFNAAKAFSSEDMAKVLRISPEAAQQFTADVAFTLSGCSHITPHEVNEELFEKVFPGKGIKDEESFRRLLGEDMEKSYNEQAQYLYVSDVRKQLLDNFDAPLPEEFLKRWFISRKDKDVTAESIENEWAEKYVPSLRWELIDGALNDIKPIEPTEDEIVEYVKDIIRRNETAKEDEDEKAFEERLDRSARSIAKDKNNVSQIKDRIYTGKVFALFSEQLNPTAVEITLNDFLGKIK